MAFITCCFCYSVTWQCSDMVGSSWTTLEASLKQYFYAHSS